MRRLSLFHCAFVSIGVLCGVSPGLAQSSGFQLFGRADFEMDAIQQKDGKPVRLRYLAARQILRIEPLDGSGQVMLINFPRGDVLIVAVEGQRGVFGRRDASIVSQRIVPADATRDIAGEQCREATINGSPACISDDGVPLMMGSPNGEVVAQRIIRQPQSPALFTVAKETKIQPFPGYSGPLPGPPF